MGATATTRLLTDAILAALVAVPNLTVGDGNAPLAEPPYAVLFVGDDIEEDGNARNIKTDVAHQFEIHHVGSIRSQAQAMQDVTRVTMTGVPLAASINAAIAPDGRVLRNQIMRDVDSGGTFPDEAEPGERLFTAVDDWIVWTTEL